MTDQDKLANAFVANSRDGWGELVALVRSTKDIHHASKVLAKAAGVGQPTLERKMRAINMAMSLGKTDEEIIEMGQSKVVGNLVAATRAKRTEKLVKMSWLVSPELKDEVERGLWNVAQALGTIRNEDVWTFVASQMIQWSKEEILHSAGEGQKEKEKC